MTLHERSVLLRALLAAHTRAKRDGDEEAVKLLEVCFEEQVELFRQTLKANKQKALLLYSSEGGFSHLRSTGVILK